MCGHVLSAVHWSHRALIPLYVDAPRLLDSVGLPRPRRIDLAHIEDPDALPAEMFLRGPPPQRRGRRVTRRALLELMRSEDLSSYSAVEFVPSIAGATTVSRDDLLLVEMVFGHLSGLLDHALLNARVLIDRSSGSALGVQHFSQDWRVDPESLEALESRVAPLSGKRLVDASLEIAAGVRDLGPNVLTELMIGRDRRVRVDAKPYPWRVELRGLLRTERECIYGEMPVGGSLLDGRWRTSDVPPDATTMSLALGSRPLTSHFVTYSLERGLAAILNW